MHNVQAKGILSTQNRMNLSRGCTHGCIYCDARSKCYHNPIPFEDIEIKENAPELLEATLKKKRKKCMIGTGGMSDPYIHIEEKILLTRRCLQIIEKYGFGLSIHTKSNRILRDIDLLDSINKKSKCVVQITLTTADENICRIVEPNVSTTRERVEVLKKMKEKGIPTVVWFDPILPFINDTPENYKTILNYCAESGVKGIVYFGAGLTLREGNREYFYEKLDRFFPGVKNRYIQNFGNAYDIVSPNYRTLDKIFYDFCNENKIICQFDECAKFLDEFPEIPEENHQPSLFDEM